MKMLKEYTSKDIISLIAALIGATGAIIAAVIGISIQNQIVECRLAVNDCINTVNSMNAEISSINNNVNTINNFITEAEKTPTTLFNEAIHAYNAGLYERVCEIYSEEKICDTPVALTNMGYLYENGYGVKQDFSKADEFYNKAIIQNYESAYTHKLAMYLKNDLPGIENVLYDGYKRNSQALEDFVTCFFSPELGTPNEILDMFCNSLSEEEQLEFIHNNIMKWDFIKYVKSMVPLDSYDNTIKYEWVNELDSMNSDKNADGSVGIYRMYRLVVLNIELLDEGFINEY